MKKLITLFFIGITMMVSAQSGITWGASANITSNTYGNMQPRMAMDANGNALVVWGRMSDESVFFSRWTGTSFSTPMKLNPSWMAVATASWMGPDIASKGDTVYVVMKRTPEAMDTNHIYIVRSMDGGMSFSAPIQVDNIADSMSRFPTVTVDASGNPIVAFMKFNSAFLESRWVVAKSTDYGNTFSIDVKASGWSGDSSEVCDCCPGAIVSSGNTTAMLYRDNLSNVRDIWTGISTNNASAFNSGFKVDNNNWMISSCPASGPDGVIVGDTLYSVFMSGASSNTLSYLSKSSISTGAFNTVNKLTPTIAGLNEQNYPRIANDGAAMAIVWEQTVGGNAQLPLLFTNNMTNGFPATYDTIDLDNITNADVALHNGSIMVVWQDGNTRTVRYRKGTYTLAPSAVNDITEGTFSIFPNPATNSLHVQSSFGLSSMNIVITDLLGKSIMTQSLLNGADLIDISSLNDGVYFIQVKTDNQFFTQKFMKQ